MSMMDNLVVEVSARGISMAITQIKSSNSAAYQNVKADVKVAAQVLTDLSNAFEDDVLTQEEAQRVLKEIADPAARDAIIKFMSSIMAQCQRNR